MRKEVNKKIKNIEKDIKNLFEMQEYYSVKRDDDVRTNTHYSECAPVTPTNADKFATKKELRKVEDRVVDLF